MQVQTPRSRLRTEGKIIALSEITNTPWSAQAIERQLGVSHQTVGRVLARKDLPHDPSKAGRPLKLDKHDRRRLVQAIQDDPFKTWADIAEEIPVQVSSDTVRRTASLSELESFIPRVKPFISDLNKAKRLVWAHDMKLQDWRRVIFTDESSLNSKGVSPTRVHRKRGEAYFPQHCIHHLQGTGPSVCVWGAIAWGKKWPLVRFRLPSPLTHEGKFYPGESVNRFIYSEQILWGHLGSIAADLTAERGEVWVVEDNAKTHNNEWSNAVRDGLRIPRLDHPPASPDLNPIEGMWQLVRSALRKLPRRPTNPAWLWTEIEKAWEEIPQDKVDRLVESMPLRVAAVRKSKGFSIGY